MKRKLAALLSIIILGLIIYGAFTVEVEKKIDLVPVADEVEAIPKSDIQEVEPSDSVISNLEDTFESDLKKLPTIDDLQTLSEEEVHHTPEMIKEGGEVIGRVHEEAQKDVTKRGHAMSFFKKCAEDDALPSAIRALCLHKIYKLVPEWKIPTPLDESKISSEVQDLSLKLE
jgi:hypothetical protein